MSLFTYLVAGAVSLGLSFPNQGIPKELWGKWAIRRTLPTRTISCWGDKDAKALIGTEIEYSSELFRWKKLVTKNPVATVRVLSAEQFHDENSGGSTNGSQVTLKELGIDGKEVTTITVEHAGAQVTGATVEIPGDYVLIKNKDTIIFSVCNVYFEARRMGPSGSR